ncbi:MAG: cysteine desulfurase [Nanoarchaeota archaeon]
MNYKKDFPIFEENKDLVYLDSAATSQKPLSVIENIHNFYKKDNSNINRGIYDLSENATRKYENARKNIGNFINAEEKEIVFTKNTTESINFLANTIKSIIKEGKNEIVLTEMEHHSNLVPWQRFANENNFKLKFIPITADYELDYNEAEKIINEKTALVSLTHVSNVFGTINNINKIINLAKENKALTLIDAAQSIVHINVDVKKINCDFLVFSGHKIFAPLGIGVLYGKKEHLNNCDPFILGGGTINSVSYSDYDLKDSLEKFEAGTQNISGVIALEESINYINKLGLNNIQEYERELLIYALGKLKKINNIIIYNPKIENHSSIISFNLKNIHPHDVASILNDFHIAIRAGHHCCMPLMKKLNISGTCRISFSVYNTKEDIDKLLLGLNKVQEVFR